MSSRITNFLGISPKIAARLLPDSGAQIADNMSIQSGELNPIFAPFHVNTPTKPLPSKAIYLALNGISQQAWFTWPYEVDVVRAPLPADVESRFYWTGEYEPKMATYSMATNGGANNYPSQSFVLGVYAPQTAPSVSVSGGTGSTVTRFYLYTFFTALGEESAPSPISTELSGKIDGTWAISSMDAFPTNSGAGTATYSGVTGLTTFTNTAAAKTWLRTGDYVVIGADTVAVTSTPSTSSFTVVGDYHTATAWARKTNWNVAGMTRRLYRTTGTLGTFELVAQNVGTTFNDNLLDSAILGDEMISAGWVPPPTNISGLIVHSSGSLIGFANNLLCMSEPYQPHAWPVKYQLSMDYNIVGLDTYSTEIVVATKGNPYIVSGIDPSSMTPDKKNGSYPCLSKRSVIARGDDVVYASAQGLVSVGANGVSLYTQNLFTKKQWQAFNPIAMVSAYTNEVLYVLYTKTDGSVAMFKFEEDALTTSSGQFTEIYADITSGTLYVADSTGISEWNSLSSPTLFLSWKSKDFVLPAPVNLGAAKIEFESVIDPATTATLLALIASINAMNSAAFAAGNIGGEIDFYAFNETEVNASNYVQPPALPASNLVTFTLFREGVPIFSRVVSTEDAFRLPAGFKADVYSVQVVSQCNIHSIVIGETMDSLRQA